MSQITANLATANLALPLIAAAQAQKHVTHNEALTGLDTLVQLACLDKDRTAPPADPAEGDRYLIAAANPAGAWAGLSGQIVRYQDGHWRAFAPRAGWLAWIADEADLYAYSGTAWIGFRATITALHNLARLGIGTTADAANPFAAKLNTALWTALTQAEGGTGDLRYTLNKQAPGNVLSLLFQSGFSGRAEIGLNGDDDLSVRVSGDGATFRDALRIDRRNGALALTAGSAQAPALTAAGDTDTGPFAPGADSWGVATGGIERLRIAPNGRVGIGTGNPRASLDVEGSLIATAWASNKYYDGGWKYKANGCAGHLQFFTSGGLGFYVSGMNNDGPGAPATDVNAISVTAAGNVGIGNPAPATRLAVEGIIAHTADNAFSFGTASLRAAVVYAATGVINTSDARDKTAVAPLTDAEIAAAGALAREIGTFRFLDAVAAKGDGARMHAGMTVQRAIEVMEAHGLDPFAYGIVCHDAWDATAPVPGHPDPRKGGTGVAGPTRPAGDRYGFRTDELLLFLARGFDARLSALEARLA